jgi:hypothetical protein
MLLAYLCTLLCMSVIQNYTPKFSLAKNISHAISQLIWEFLEFSWICLLSYVFRIGRMLTVFSQLR